MTAKKSATVSERLEGVILSVLAHHDVTADQLHALVCSQLAAEGPTPVFYPAPSTVRRAADRLATGRRVVKTEARIIGEARMTGAGIEEPARYRLARKPANLRRMLEVLELDRNCELGEQGERAVVAEVDSDGACITLLFPSRSADRREVRTGADYAYLRSV